MLEPSVPFDEATRLAALRGLEILDTPPEERFDRLTRLARQLLSVPIALVSLVDSNRQWFKSCQGLDASETPRSISFCGHAILDDRLFVIPDTLLDARFADNPLVTGAPHIRFYAGQPLKSVNGSRLGTLCVIDRKPHQLTQTEESSLRDLAVLVENELNAVELNEASRALKSSQNRLASILDNVLDGIITINERGIVESFNKSSEHIFGYAAAEVIGNNIKMLMPEPYQSEHDGYLHNFASTGRKKIIGIGREVVGRRKDGSTFPMDLAVSEMRLEDNRMFTGIVRDITERKHAEAELAQHVHELDERVKEQYCLHQLANLTADATLSLTDFFARAVPLLPPAWQHPESACARIVFEGRAYSSENFALSPWRIVAPIVLNEVELGAIEVAYPMEMPVADDGPFLHEERQLLHAFSRQVAQTIEMRRAEAAMQESAQLVQSIVENIVDGIITISERGTVESFNKSAEHIFGYAAAEVIGNNVKMLMPEPYHSEHDGYLHNFASTGRKKIIGIGREVVGRRKDGSTFPMDLAVSEMRLEDNRMFTGIVRDITERKKVERIQAQFSAIISSSMDAIMSKTLDGIVTSWNPAAERMFGYTEQEMLGKPTLLLIPAERADEESQILAKIRRGEHIEHFVTIRRRKNGETFPISVTLSPIRSEDGTIIGASKIARDISEQVKIEKMKSEFISTVSHELRTPLTSIRGSLALIVGGVVGELPAAVKPLVEIAHKNSERLILLVNDILDMEKIEAGKMEFDLKPSKIMPLLEQALEGNRAYGEQFHVSYELANALPDVMVNVDANRLMQVFANLLSNAAKFSPSGGKVQVAVEHIGQRIRVSVKDNGAGIPAEFKGQIFQKFAQADASDTKKKGGTGLGLSITKAIIEQMGGSIDFESQPNVLTTFFFEFPLWNESPAPVLPIPVVSEKTGQKRILICEDDRDIAALLRLMLEQEELVADIAYDAAQAKQLLVQHSYAAMTLDIGLPDQSGTSLIRELRSAKETAALPIIVVSANAALGSKELDGEVFNVIDWITKPIDHHQLVMALEQAVGKFSQARSIVLHIEDDQDIVQVVKRIVGDEAEIENALTLADAQRMLAGKRYDLVILDLTLPDGSGMELLSLLNSASPPIPVMVFSANEMAMKDIQVVNSALVKSRTDNAQLLATIKRLIKVD